MTTFKALAVLSSDAISSVAYATEAILLTLVAGGSGNPGLTLPISFVIVALLGIVRLSYRQRIPAYPNCGGSYIVAKENLGTVPGLVAAASLMIDYVLSITVSAAAVCWLSPSSWNRCCYYTSRVMGNYSARFRRGTLGKGQ